MSQTKRSQTSWISVLPSLIVPVCFGMILYIGLLALIRHGVIENETALRYLTGHPVSKISVAMFFVGGASLLLIGLNICSQFATERQLHFLPLAEDTVAGDASLDDKSRAVALGQQLHGMPNSVQQHYLWQRLNNALHFVYRGGSADGVDDEIKYLSELDLDRQQQRYSLVRILIWATPMLGFLGTVLGISQALGGIAVGPDNDFQAMMDGLRGSLYVAFDTTALALTLSMILMFAQFLVDRFETQLLSLVDQRSRAEIASQFDLSPASPVVSNASELSNQQLITTIEQMVMAQTDVWTKSIRAAEQAWAASLTQTSDVVRSEFVDSVQHVVGELSVGLDESIKKADGSMARRWGQWQVMLSDNARQLSQQQQELTEQTSCLESLAARSSGDLPLAEAMAKTNEALAATGELQQAIAGLAGNLNSLEGTGITRVTGALEALTARLETVVAAQLVAANDETDVALEEIQASATPIDEVEFAQESDEAVVPAENAQSKPQLPIVRRFVNAKTKEQPVEVKLTREEEVVLPIGPYLSGEKTIAGRRRGSQSPAKRAA